jgi:hypothetical protein
MLEQIYRRRLPGGGFVAIDVTSRMSLTGRRYRGAVVVERRGDQVRRSGHTAPVIARAEAGDVATVFSDLLPVAQSNVEIARRCIVRAPVCGKSAPRFRV